LLSVLLRCSRDLKAVKDFSRSVRIPDLAAAAHANSELQNSGEALESAFDAEAETWWSLARALATEPSAGLAHMPCCVPNASDFGAMLAWTRLVRQWVEEKTTTLVICDDPWVFRHLSRLTGVMAGAPPPLWKRFLLFWLRGYASRSLAALRFMRAAIRMRSMRRRAMFGSAWLLVYGHPSSTADGTDGYFGNLMIAETGLKRILHVDCTTTRAMSLAENDRTLSLHAFGNPWYAFVLPFARWRPQSEHLKNECAWLIRRAVAQEGGTGQAAAILWQTHCQRRWLKQCRPAAVAWPWENQAWERAFVRAARALAVRTIGYQHSVIGRQMLNYSSASNCDGVASLPDRILCVGESTRSRLERWGVPTERLAIGGALRFQSRRKPRYSPDGPIFMALPFDGTVAHQMVEAARDVGAAGRAVVVKGHPMTPFAFDDSKGLKRTAIPLQDHPALSAVVYAATSVGLEALIAGLPTLRFRPHDRIALDILPDHVDVHSVEAETLCDSLNQVQVPEHVVSETIFAPVDWAIWRKELIGAFNSDEE